MWNDIFQNRLHGYLGVIAEGQLATRISAAFRPGPVPDGKQKGYRHAQESKNRLLHSPVHFTGRMSTRLAHQCSCQPSTGGQGRDRRKELTHNGHSSGDKSWTPPEPSRASRSIPLRSIASYRGSVFDPTRNRLFSYESKPERGLTLITLADKETAGYHEQPHAVEFIWPDGRKGKHTFDGLRVDKDGLRVAIDVKLKNKIISSGIREIQELIKEQVGSDFADVYVIRTEEHIHEDDVADAELALRAFQFGCASSDAVLTQLIANLYGWCRVRDLVAAAGIGANGYYAAVRLIREGMLEVRGDCRISFQCFVRRSRV
jgi:hypothetical protein